MLLMKVRLVTMNNIRTIINKEFISLKNNKSIVSILFVLPSIFSIVFPIMILTLGTNDAIIKSIAGLSAFLEVIPADLMPSNLPTVYYPIYAILNFFTLPLFLLIPVMIANVLSSEGFIGEKENKSLEGLLYTPISIRSLVIGKILSALIPSILITWLFTLIYEIIFTTGSYFTIGNYIFLDSVWLYASLFLAPLLTILSIALVFAISPYVGNTKSAQSIALIIVVPIMAMLISQASGAILLKRSIILFIIALLFVIDFIVVAILIKRFNIEKYILS
ncbi:ABC transporter permease subunit [Aerococcus sanguinicola]|nr:ABC transporter permease subunit [Aerococcus sanguinicola]MDK6233846.1 ABC transporter permease subunit [Aerococcus sp. UMB10185]